MILASDKALKDHNLKPLARLVGWSRVGVDPMMMGTAAVPAVQALLKTTGLTMDDMDLVEVDIIGMQLTREDKTISSNFSLKKFVLQYKNNVTPAAASPEV